MSPPQPVPTTESAEPGADEPGNGEPRNGLGTIGFVLGLLSALFALIPGAYLAAGLLAPLGTIYGAIGFRRGRVGRASNTWFAFAGMFFGIFGLIAGAVSVQTTSQGRDSGTGTSTVVYEVTGEAAETFIAYGAFGYDDPGMRTTTAFSLPWRVQALETDLSRNKRITMTVIPIGRAETVTCTLTIDGKIADRDSTSADHSIAQCIGP